MVPVQHFTLKGGKTFYICFEAETETVSMRQHFKKDCGWSNSQVDSIKNFAWFSAAVSIVLDGEVLHTEYLGCCCYKKEEEFWTTYKSDYYADKVLECAEFTKDAELITLVEQWRTDVRKDQPHHNHQPA